MDGSINQARKAEGSPSTSSSYLNIAAFGNMAYPVTEDMYTDYYDDTIMGGSSQGLVDMTNTQQDYYEDPNEADHTSFQQQQIYQHHLKHQYQSTEPSINTPSTPSIEVKFEDLYDNPNLSGGEKSTRRLSSNIHSRRRAQNRASQRAFRERKEQHVKEVEAELADVKAKYESLEEKYRATKKELEYLKAATSKDSSHGGGTLCNESQFDAFLEGLFQFDADEGHTHGSG